MTFGVDYYPEQWKESDWEEDFLLMKKMGIQSVRMAEFAWALMEPKEGKFDFSFWHRIVDLCYKHNLSVVLGTPTATFPPWLFKKHPSIVQTTKEGIQRIIGSRRQASYSSPIFLEYANRICTKMAQEFGNHPAVIGWQIDNEIGHEGSDIDYSENSLIAFRLWLKEKYKTIEAVNEAWGTVFWGAIYNDFSEIFLPGNHLASGFHPTMILDFYRFNSDVLVRFVKSQTEIIKKNTNNQFITTNLYPSPFLPVTDMAELFQNLDMVSWDNYPVWGNQKEPFPHPFVGFMLQYARGLKNKPFIVMEQFSGQQGHDTLGYLPAPGEVGLWLLQSIAHGADKTYFFRFRTARFGQEQLCYGILDHDKSINHKFLELQKTIQSIQEFAEDIRNVPYKSDVALLHDRDNSRNFKFQPLSDGLKLQPVPYVQLGYDVELATWFSASSILNTGIHLRPTSLVKLEDYKVIILPLYSIVDTEFYQKLERWVAGGGTLVLGYRSGIKDKNAWMNDSIPPGIFQKMAGVQVHRFESVGTDSVKIRFRLLPGSCSKVCEILEPTTATPIAWYSDSSKHYNRSPVATVNTFEKGKVYYIGSSFSPESFVLLFRRIYSESNIPFQFLGSKLERLYREGKKFNYTIWMNHSSKSSWIGFRRLAPYSFCIKKQPKS